MLIKTPFLTGFSTFLCGSAKHRKHKSLLVLVRVLIMGVGILVYNLFSNRIRRGGKS